jgi:hypothetical protein
MSDLNAVGTQAATERRILISMSMLWQIGEVYELRILRPGREVLSGYYNDPLTFARDAAQWDGRAIGIYWTINPCKPDLLARAENRLREHTPIGEATSDKDIVRRRFLPLDLDPVRAATHESDPATHQEHCEALALQGRIADSDFMSRLGFPRPIEMDSGNGAYLLYPIDLPNDDASKTTIKRCLEALARRFNCDRARVDTSVYNASRIMRVPGTLNCKGTPALDRPHRRTLLTIVPGAVL